MKQLLERLEQLQPIVTTVRAQDIAEKPEIIRNGYEFVSSVFYAFESVKRDLRDSMLKRLLEGKPILGYVSGEYGYGKTATMVWLWHQCEQKDLVAVPPFGFYSWDDLLLASTKWLAFRLKEKRPDVAEKAEDLYNRYRSRAVEELAVDIAKRQRVSIEQARRIIEELVTQGRLTLLSAHQVADFLKEAAEVAKEGGFKGFIAFADETQHFVDQPSIHERIEQIRMFVSAFRTKEMPSGLFFGFTDRVAERISEQAGDMMQRIQDYGAFLKLQSAYTRDFPQRLWEHLCRTYSPEGKEMVDEAALEAMGQICERSDLSNGPRTVIAAFKGIARHWSERSQPYTVWQLIEDYENRRIVFEGQEQKITTILRTLLNEPVVQENPDFQKGVRFLCAFPEGVSKKVAERYRIWKAIDDLANTWGFLGTHIYEPQPGHFALTGLRRLPVEGIDKFTTLLQRFRNRWWHYVSEKEKWQIAKIAFMRFVMPELFSKRSSGEQSKWTGHPKLGEERDLASVKVASVILEGSFEGTQSRFPQRRVALALSDDESALSRWQPKEEDLDLTFRFFILDLPEDVAGEIVTTTDEPVVDFRLNLNRHYDQYPSDLEIFRNIMSPHHCTALVLLNLVMFVDAEMQRPDVPDSYRQLLEHNLLRPAVRHIVALLFNDQMRKIGIGVKGVGQTLIEQAFAKKCEELYPDYKPLLTGRQRENDLKRYQDILLKGGLSRSEKQGIRAKVMSREEMAKQFDIAASQLDALVERLQEMGLIKVRETKTVEGRKWEVTFTEHPLEQRMRKWLQELGSEVTLKVRDQKRKVKQIGRSELQKRARRWRAHPDEIKGTLQLAQGRGTLEYDENKVREAVVEVNPDEIRGEAEKLRQQLEPLINLFPEDVRRYEEQLDKIVARTLSEDEAQWEEARYDLGQTRAALKEFAHQKANQVKQNTHQISDSLRNLQVRLPLRELERRIELTLRLAEYLDDQRRQLHKDAQRLHSDLQKSATESESIGQKADHLQRVEDLEQALKQLADVAKDLHDTQRQSSQLESRANDLRTYVDALEAWKAVANDADELRSRIPDRYSDLRGQLEEWVQQVMDHFAEHKREALKEHERFDYELRSVKAELARRVQSEREAFGHLVEEFERQLRGITDARLSARYISEDPEGSYEQLFNEVLQKLSETIGKLGFLIQQDRARITFLRVIRQRETKELERGAEELDNEWQSLRGEINYEVIKAFRDGDKFLPQICEAIRKWISRRGEFRQRLNEADKPLPTDEEEEALLKLVREVALSLRGERSLSLAQIWEAAITNSAFPPEKLLALVERLYRKGWLEIHIKECK